LLYSKTRVIKFGLIMGRKITTTLILLSVLFIADCKKKDSADAVDDKSKDSQILGTRYSRFWHNLTTTPGGKEKVKVDSSKEKSPFVAVLEFEEVTAIEKVTENQKDYFRVKTVTGQEGFAETRNYTEGIYVVKEPYMPAFRKPTITAGTKGNLDSGSYCLIKEIQGEWANVDCLTAKYKPKGGGIEDWYDVWIQTNDPKIVMNPLLNETAKIYREIAQLQTKISKGEGDLGKHRSDIESKLEKALSKEDQLAPIIKEFIERETNEQPSSEANVEESAPTEP
jgi:lipoprotein LenA